MKVFFVMMIATWIISLSYAISSIFSSWTKLHRVGRVWLTFLIFIIVVSFTKITLIEPIIEYFRPYSSGVEWAIAGCFVGLASGFLAYYALKK